MKGRHFPAKSNWTATASSTVSSIRRTAIAVGGLHSSSVACSTRPDRIPGRRCEHGSPARRDGGARKWTALSRRTHVLADIATPRRKRLGAGRQHSRPDRRRFPDERRRTECRWIIGKKTAEDGPQAGRSVGFSDGQPGRAHANLPGSVTGGPLTNCRSGWPTSGNSERSDSRAFFGGMDVIMGWLSIATS